MNVGSDPVSPSPAGDQPVGGQARRPLMGIGSWRSRRSTPSAGKAAHMGKGGSVISSRTGGGEVVVE